MSVGGSDPSPAPAGGTDRRKTGIEMSESVNTYEGMFLVDAGSDFNAASAPVRTVLERSDAELLAIKPWEERRLAYSIGGRRRGLYVLVYFKADPLKVVEIERDTQLSEDILRALILHNENVSEEDIAAETPATQGPRRSDDEGDSRRDGGGRSSSRDGSGRGDSRRGESGGPSRGSSRGAAASESRAEAKKTEADAPPASDQPGGEASGASAGETNGQAGGGEASPAPATDGQRDSGDQDASS